MSRQGDFMIFCTEQYKSAKKLNGKQVAELFSRYQVWDYRREPLNWRGHICLRFSLLWCGLAGLWMCLDKPRRLS